MLCAGIYLLAHQIWKGVRVPAGQEGQVTLVCCGSRMKEEKHGKLTTQLSKSNPGLTAFHSFYAGISMRLSAASGLESLLESMSLPL